MPRAPGMVQSMPIRTEYEAKQKTCSLPCLTQTKFAITEPKTPDLRLSTLAGEMPDLKITRHLVETPEEAERVRFRGSPSILVDGVDVFADADAPVGLSCRVYQTANGPAGAPTLDELREAVTRG